MSMSLLAELKRRNVFRMGIAYAVVAWVLLQAIDFVLDIIAAPDWVVQVFVLAAVVGLPVVLIFSWIWRTLPAWWRRATTRTRCRSPTS